jgi:hypothetical protein
VNRSRNIRSSDDERNQRIQAHALLLFVQLLQRCTGLLDFLPLYTNDPMILFIDSSGRS